MGTTDSKEGMDVMNKGFMRLLAGGLLGLVLGVGAEASSGAQVLGQVLEGGLPVVGAEVWWCLTCRICGGGVLAVGTTDAAGEFALSLASTSSARRGFDRTSAGSVESLSSTGLGLAQTPVGFRLGPNYPNPFCRTQCAGGGRTVVQPAWPRLFGP